jgi:threonyl-tRNA synthetase
VRAIPVAESFIPYLSDVVKEFQKAGIRVELDRSDDRMQTKVRNAQLEKIPFMMIAGDEDVAVKAVSFRYRNGEQKNQIPIKDAIAEVIAIVKDRKQI